MQDSENSQTAASLARVHDYWQNAQALLQLTFEDDTRRWSVAPIHTKIVGTRWHYSDLYSKLLDRDVPSMIRKAIEDGELLFPTALDQETLDKHRTTMGSAKFSSQYMNDPIDPESAIFKREFTTYFEAVDEHTLNIALTVDLAIDEKSTADESAIVVTGICPAGKLYVLDYESGRWPPSRVVDACYRLFKRWRASFVFFESNNYQKVFAYILHEEGRKRRHFLPVRPVRSIGKKYTRIVALQPLHESGRLLIRREQTELEDQLHRYPKVGHDDLADALSMRIQRMVWAEALGAPADDVGEFTFAAAERELDAMDDAAEAGEAPLINPSSDWTDFWPR